MNSPPTSPTAPDPPGIRPVHDGNLISRPDTWRSSRSANLACGNRPRKDAKVTHVSDDLTDATCRVCPTQLGLDQLAEEYGRLAALFVVAITLGLRRGALRALRWDHDTMGHKSTHVTETVYRHVIVPAIRGGASVMDDVFGDTGTGSH